MFFVAVNNDFGKQCKDPETDFPLTWGIIHPCTVAFDGFQGLIYGITDCR